MSKVEARLDRVECTVRVSWAPETVSLGYPWVRQSLPPGNLRAAPLRAAPNRSVVIAAPTKVQWSAYLNRADGRVYAAVTVYGNTPEGDPWNTSFLPDFEDVPSWIPAPPAWYVDAVAELRAAGEDLSKRVSR